ncbi:hypothetical protein [Streptomyces sp. NBC_01497]|uniref:hypothetical protein n=1 Tax=Streptomyces sp. NBC_01497 TaxID=2903885 RepID=UPI002E31F21D|nr:hypothetical protein [Streptomyces sp. NBC_01497]
MISEPELEGEDWPSRPGDRPGGFAPGVPGQRDGNFDTPADPGPGPVLVGDGIPAPAPRRAALTWGLWGALAASLLWGAGLTLYHSRGPDLGGYGPERDLCLDAPLSALSKVLGPAQTPEAASDETSAVDSAVCRTDLGTAPPGSPLRTLPGLIISDNGGVRTLVDLRYVLHRSTDPAPEFDALPQAKSPGWALHTLRVPDLGTRAYLITDSVGEMPPTLRVLDGRAEFTLTLSVYSSYDGRRAAASDVRPVYVSAHVVDVLAPAMTDDMRALMRTVRSAD